MRRLAIAAIVLFAAAPGARASDTDQFGFGARPIALGGAYAALATDWSGAYYNPAGPAAAKASSLALGFSYADYDLEFRSEAGGETRDRETARQQPLSALTLGTARKLSDDPSSFLSRLALGIGLLLPTRQLVAAQVETGPTPGSTGQTPQFFLYGSRRDKIAVLPFLGLRVLPWGGDEGQVLAVGAGASVLADLVGGFAFDLSTTAASAVAIQEELAYDVAPNAGIFYWPLPWLSIGIAYRGELSLKADFDVSIKADGTELFPLQVEAVTLFQPQQVSGGIAVDPADWATVSVEVTWANWSAFDDPFVTIRPVLPQADVDFEDIVIPRAGVELEPGEGVAVRLGYYYQPSPIPPQRGATNLVDLDKHVASFGLGWTWWTDRRRAVEEDGAAKIVTDRFNPVSIDAFFQWHHMVEDRVSKDPAASQKTGSFYEAGGDIFNFGIQLTIRN